MKKVEEEDTRNIECFTCYSLKPYVCNEATRADLEANMYDHSKRVIFSQAMLKKMSMERTFWQNWNWEDGPRNGQVNGACFNTESTETWEELQATEDELKKKQQPRRNRNNKRREQKKLSAKVQIQRLKTEISGWAKVVHMTSAKNGDEGTVAALKGTKVAKKWWLRRETRTEVEFQVYVNTMATIRRECPHVYDVISSWAEAYFKVAETGLHFLDKPTGEEIRDGTFKYAKTSGSALYRIAQAGASLIDRDLTMAIADSMQLQEKMKNELTR